MIHQDYLDSWADYQDFQDFISSLNLRYFKAHELLGSVGKMSNSGVRNEAPPKEIWNNIVPTLIVLDELRAQMGSSIGINSCYRFPAYNAIVPGSSKRSMHTTFRAVDFRLGSGPLLKKATNLLKEWRADENKWFESPVPITFQRVLDDERYEKPTPVKEENGKHYFRYVGGVGLYDTFTHFDTRGYNADWDKRSKSKSLVGPPLNYDDPIEFGE